MILITGGAYQGKTTYLHQIYPELSITDGSVCTFDEAASAACINHYHELVARLMEKSIDPVAWTSDLCKQNPDCIILLNEIGSGIIPIEKADRIRREQTGICGCIIAVHAKSVIRVTCGIPTASKGELL